MVVNDADAEVVLKGGVGVPWRSQATAAHLLADGTSGVFTHLIAQSVKAVLQERLCCRHSLVAIKRELNLLERNEQVIRHHRDADRFAVVLREIAHHFQNNLILLEAIKRMREGRAFRKTTPFLAVVQL